MIDTILNTYCEVEFLCKDNSPNWIGPFILFVSGFILGCFEGLSQNIMLIKNKDYKIENPIGVGLKCILVIFFISLFFGWTL